MHGIRANSSSFSYTPPPPHFLLKMSSNNNNNCFTPLAAGFTQHPTVHINHANIDRSGVHPNHPSHPTQIAAAKALKKQEREDAWEGRLKYNRRANSPPHANPVQTVQIVPTRNIYSPEDRRMAAGLSSFAAVAAKGVQPRTQPTFLCKTCTTKFTWDDIPRKIMDWLPLENEEEMFSNRAQGAVFRAEYTLGERAQKGSGLEKGKGMFTFYIE